MARLVLSSLVLMAVHVDAMKLPGAPPPASSSAAAAMRAALRITPSVTSAFANDGCVVLRNIAANGVAPPLKAPGRCCCIEEEEGILCECELAAALSCTLLSAPAVCDPAGSCGHDVAYGHYNTAHLVLEQMELEPADAAIAIVIREPTCLDFGTALPNVATAVTASCRRLLEDKTGVAVFCSSGDADDVACGLMVDEEASDDDIAGAIELDAGDVVVIRGDHSGFTVPPDGLGGGMTVYRFAGCCDAADPYALYQCPMHSARMSLQRALLARAFDLDV